MATITLTAEDGQQLAGYRAAPPRAPRGGLVIVQEIFGVNSHIKRVCDGFAADGYLALAAVLSDGTHLAAGKPQLSLAQR